MLKITHPHILGSLALLLCALTVSEPAFAFGKPPISTPPNPAPPPSNNGAVIDARWDSVTGGDAWSQYVYNSIPSLAPNLLSVTPKDIANFCPTYSQLSVSDKTNFWVYLVSSISQLESDFDPTSIYTENFTDSSGNLVQSVGLLQLSIGDAPNYGCTNFSTTADVEDPDTNLACGLRILNKWIGSDRVISGESGSTWIGGARYWSTLRTPKVDTIQSWTKALPICGG